jgi:hypothetical protein
MNSTRKKNTKARFVAELKKRRYENYLKLKKEFENDKKKGLNQIPERKKH